MNVGKISFVSRSAVGLVREDNEDSLYTAEERGIFAVADGMGGGDEGARASSMVCDAINNGVSAAHFLDRLDQVREAIGNANRDIFAYARKQGHRQMGSTVALLAIEPKNMDRAAIAYVGDSRVYRFRDGKAELLTRDHSVGAELEEKVGGRVGERFAARSNPLAHVLTRAIGTGATVEVEWRKVDVLPRDRFLVCSDGVHDVITTEDLPRFVGKANLNDAAQGLEDEVVRRGAPDNYSFILIEIGALT